MEKVSYPQGYLLSCEGKLIFLKENDLFQKVGEVSLRGRMVGRVLEKVKMGRLEMYYLKFQDSGIKD